MATFIKGDKIKPLVVLEEDLVEQEVDGMTAIGIPKDKYPNLCEYLYVSFDNMILTRQLGGPDGESGMYSVVYHYPYPQEGEPSDKMLTYSISYTIMGVSDDGNYYLCIPAVTTTFVTKSNDEQLSSIELSRAATYEGYELSEDIKNNFKQNIGISGGADWNAAYGKAGYIENKPFFDYINLKLLSVFEVISEEHSEGGHGEIGSTTYQLESYGNVFPLYIKHPRVVMGEFNGYMITKMNPGDEIYKSDGFDTYYKITAGLDTTDENSVKSKITIRTNDDFLVNNIYCHDWEEDDFPIVEIDKNYIPDTIARKSDIPVPIIINYNTIKDAANSEVNTISEQTWLKYIVNDTYKNYDWIIQRDGIKYNCTVIPDYDNKHIQILYFTRNEIEGTSGPLGNAIMKYSGLRIKLLPYTENTYLIYKISNGGSLETREFVFGENYNNNAYLIAAAQMSGIDTIDCKWVYTTKADKTITVNGQYFHIENSITNVDAIFSVKDKSLTYVDGNGLINKVTFADNGSYAITPDTVVKTTPQTLSDTDKNQALANLGIDPIVWKYMCNPYIIELNSATSEVNNAIPEELSDMIYQNGKFNHLVLSTVLVKIYYTPEDDDKVIWKVERITSYTHVGTVIFNGEMFGYDPNTRKFVY